MYVRNTMIALALASTGLIGMSSSLAQTIPAPKTVEFDVELNVPDTEGFRVEHGASGKNVTLAFNKTTGAFEPGAASISLVNTVGRLRARLEGTPEMTHATDESVKLPLEVAFEDVVLNKDAAQFVRAKHESEDAQEVAFIVTTRSLTKPKAGAYSGSFGITFDVDIDDAPIG